MTNFDQRFEDFRCDFIAHLSARFGLAPDVVSAHLGAWLLDRRAPDQDWSDITSVRPLRTRPKP